MGRVSLWARGVDLQRFDPAKRDPAWRSAHGVAADEPMLLFASRLVREKRLATVIGMAERLRSGPPHRIAFVGEGPERPMLEAALPDAIFTGFLVGEALPTAYASSDIFVFPSDTETFGSVTLEAMASGLPTLCADATGSRSLVEPGVTGFLEPADDDEAFARRALALIQDPALRRRMGDAARERSRLFSWNAAMGGLLQRYGAVVGEAERKRTA